MAATVPSLRPVRIWLLIVALLVAAMVLVGGATRLTESGLSITEWKPVTGALPPLSAEAWDAEFAKYKQIPQYEQLNRGMDLSDFKTIYFWEWSHRLLGRVIGLVFLLPLLFFWWRGYLSRALAPKLFVLFVLGGLQGAVGWWMVASGLVDRVSVAPYRLAVHLSLAFFLFAAIVWVLRSLSPPGTAVPRNVKAGAWAVLIIAFVQVFLGAIVAGLDAGMSFTTWPLMDGHFIPGLDSLSALQPGWRNFFENPMTSQFVHRMTAYTLLIAALLHAVQARHSALKKSAIVLAGLVLLQAVLGILTLVNLVPIPLALAHQLGALFVIGHGAGHVQRASAGT
jgi:cytochrome c oxidase assembly protein subunit 15